MKNVLKLHLFAILIACHAAATASATVVSFTFSGTINYIANPSNALPASITYGAPFTGIFTYDTSAIVDGIDYAPSTNSGDYYFDTNGGFSLSMTVAGHTFSNLKHTSQAPYASIVTHNDFFGFDSFAAADSFPYVVMDGGALPGDADNSGLTLYFEDESATALNSDALPIVPPQLAKFTDNHRVELYVGKNQTLLFDIGGQITNITSTLSPVLNIHLQPDKTALLSWPLATQGFGLQQNTNLAVDSGWQTNSTAVVDTATEHTVTVPGSGSMFFRLISP